MGERVECLYLEGKVVPYEHASAHMLSPAVRYGASIFEELRGYLNQEKNQLFVSRLTDHSNWLHQFIKGKERD
jgi:branched-chain amino acid aminotransferase